MKLLKHDLYLHVLHRHGMSLQTTLTVTDDTVLGEEQLAEFVPETAHAWLAEMQCAVTWHAGGNEEDGWWLECHSRRWRCSVNEVALDYQQSVLLHPGDRIELGMLHLEVGEADDKSFIENSAPRALNSEAGNVAMVVDTTPIKPLGQDDIAVALTSLTCGEHEPYHRAVNADPFDIVPSVGTTDLGTKGDVDSMSIKPGGNLLDELAQDYIQAIQDPEALQMQRGMQAMPTTLSEAGLCAAAEMTTSNFADLPIEDMVSGTLGVAHLMQKFGKEEWQLPSSAPNQNVLQLFAHGIAKPKQRANLPTLTRREHHAFSPDSSYQAGRTTGTDTAQHSPHNPEKANPT